MLLGSYILKIESMKSWSWKSTVCAAFVGCSFALRVDADVLVSGSATIDYHKGAWDSLAGGSSVSGFEALTLDEVFDQAAAGAVTGSQLSSIEQQANPSYSGLVYAMNGSTVDNLAGRYSKATDFSFDAGSLTPVTGAIGLGGVSRWAVNPLLGGGKLLFGDFTLKYDVARVALGGSGWHLVGNIPPAGVLFDLVNVVTSLGQDSLSISGDLTVSYEVANFLFATPADQGVDVGDFRFTGTTAVPEPSTLALVSLAALAAWGASRRR